MADITAVWKAVPLSPDDTDDCCQRLCDRASVETRDHAREWLVFLTALGCVHNSGDGYYREEPEPDEKTSRDAFTNRLLGVEDVLAVLDSTETALSVDNVLAELSTDTRQRIERTVETREYVARLLEWGVVLGSIEKRQGRYTTQ